MCSCSVTPYRALGSVTASWKTGMEHNAVVRVASSVLPDRKYLDGGKKSGTSVTAGLIIQFGLFASFNTHCT